jgi:hypothetical protein
MGEKDRVEENTSDTKGKDAEGENEGWPMKPSYIYIGRSI